MYRGSGALFPRMRLDRWGAGNTEVTAPGALYVGRYLRGWDSGPGKTLEEDFKTQDGEGEDPQARRHTDLTWLHAEGPKGKSGVCGCSQAVHCGV